MSSDILSEGAGATLKLEVGTLRPFMKFHMLKCKGKTDPKFPVNAGFLCIKAPVSAAVLREMIRSTQSISFCEADTEENSEEGVYFNFVLVHCSLAFIILLMAKEFVNKLFYFMNCYKNICNKHI
jgi:hypothetical protein